MVVERPGGSEPSAHERPVALGQVAEHVAFSLKSGVVSSPGSDLVGPPVRRWVRWAQFSFGACLRTPCRSELSRLLNSLWAVVSVGQNATGVRRGRSCRAARARRVEGLLEGEDMPGG